MSRYNILLYTTTIAHNTVEGLTIAIKYDSYFKKVPAMRTHA